MDINEEYRWNTPIVTYGFDQTFLDYFGSNGVAAVEKAVQIINDLPPASNIVLTNFPFEQHRFNTAAMSQQLFDLKSITLALLLEHMGLSQPERNIYDIRKFDPLLLVTGADDWPTDAVPDLILMRNFDPETLGPTNVENGQLFTGFVEISPFTPGVEGPLEAEPWEATERTVDPLGEYSTAVADLLVPGSFSAHDDGLDWNSVGLIEEGLTYDDAGGIKYLLSSNNVNLEILLDDVHGTGTNAGSFVNLALRPGIEKLTFTRHPSGDGCALFGVFTNQYWDTYISNGFVFHQQLERVVTQPDILFSASDFRAGSFHTYDRTGTTNWWNSASFCGSINVNGPGIIRPPARITFEKLGPFMFTSDDRLELARFNRWGSFDFSNDPPVAYPSEGTGAGQGQMVVNVSFLTADGPGVPLAAPIPFGSQAVLETSADLKVWHEVPDLGPVLNYGGITYWNIFPRAAQMFFRVRPLTNP